MAPSYHAIVILHYHKGGHPEQSVYQYPVTSLDDLTQGFLKRFGNETFTRKLERQRPIVKRYTWDASDVYHWVSNIGKHTDFKLSIIYRNTHAPMASARIIRWPESDTYNDIPYTEYKHHQRSA